MLNKDATRQVVYLGLSVLATALAIMVGSVWPLVAVVVLVIGHLIFRDTMNRFQWFPFWGESKHRIYWITKDNATSIDPIIGIGHVYFNMNSDLIDPAQYFRGTGVYVRIHHWSFQVGFGRRLQTSPWHRVLEVPVEEIKKGVHGVWEEEDVAVSSGADS